MNQQKTIKREVKVSGVGLHTGERANLCFRPAPADRGVRFRRIDLNGSPEIPAEIGQVMEAPRRTSLGKDRVRIHTVEHVLAAIAGLGIDNLLVEVDASEVPEIDGSSLPFVSLLQEAGIEGQGVPRRPICLRDPVWVSEEGTHLAALPCDRGLHISFTIDYNHPGLQTQYESLEMNEEIFSKEIACARTFCLENEVEMLRGQGLGKGANFENTVVVGKKGGVKGKLRHQNEFVRHKILDLIGDLSLLGSPLQAHIVATRSGHSLNIKLVNEIKARHEKERAGVSLRGFGRPAEEQKTVMDIRAIRRILPHRYPMLLVDRIVEIEEGKRIVGIKNVTGNEDFFGGHFPNRPVMPGVLIVEAMAQTAGVLFLKKEENRGKLAYIMSIDKVKLRKPVVPGDQLRLEVRVSKLRKRAGKVETRALVEGQLVAEGELTFSLVEA